MILARRSFLTGLVGLVAAPAVVKASSLMPVRGLTQQFDTSIFIIRTRLPSARWRQLNFGVYPPNDIFSILEDYAKIDRSLS